MKQDKVLHSYGHSHTHMPSAGWEISDPADGPRVLGIRGVYTILPNKSVYTTYGFFHEPHFADALREDVRALTQAYIRKCICRTEG